MLIYSSNMSSTESTNAYYLAWPSLPLTTFCLDVTLLMRALSLSREDDLSTTGTLAAGSELWFKPVLLAPRRVQLLPANKLPI